MTSRNKYENPLTSRYASAECSLIFSPNYKFSTWRKMWLRLAEGEQQLGLQITDQQLNEMRAHLTLDETDYEVAAAKEKELRHDVMAHVHAFGLRCPSAMPILHLGATSCFIADNTELIQIQAGLRLVKRKLMQVVSHLRTFADANKDTPTLGFTHYQPAQLVTIGKRATLWLQDFLMDFETLDHLLENLPFRGVKGTTGTQASFLELFNGDHEKVKALNAYVTKASGFNKAIGVSGQTYTRKLDFQVCSCLSQIAQSAYKLGKCASFFFFFLSCQAVRHAKTVPLTTDHVYFCCCWHRG